MPKRRKRGVAGRRKVGHSKDQTDDIIFRRKCPHCLKAVSFRAAEERAGGKVKVTTVACTSCGVVVGVLPQLNRLPEKREVESIIRAVVRRHVNAAVKRLRRRRARPVS